MCATGFSESFEHVDNIEALEIHISLSKMIHRVMFEGHDWSHLRLCANSDVKASYLKMYSASHVEENRWRRPLMLLMYDVKQL